MCGILVGEDWQESRPSAYRRLQPDNDMDVRRARHGDAPISALSHTLTDSPPNQHTASETRVISFPPPPSIPPPPPASFPPFARLPPSLPPSLRYSPPSLFPLFCLSLYLPAYLTSLLNCPAPSSLFLRLPSMANYPNASMPPQAPTGQTPEKGGGKRGDSSDEAVSWSCLVIKIT